MSEKPRPVVGDNRTQVQRFIEILAHCRRGGVLDVANIDEMLAYFAQRQAETNAKVPAVATTTLPTTKPLGVKLPGGIIAAEPETLV